MNLLAIRFMLFHSRIELALSILGENRQRIAQARADVARWEAERDRALLLGEMSKHD